MIAVLVSLAVVLLLLIQHKRIEIDTTQAVEVQAAPETIWAQIQDFEGFWERSNPEVHAGTRVLSNPKQPLRNGLRFYQKEQVGGVTGELDAEVYDVEPNRRFRWRTKADYRLLGLRITIPEGGTFRVEPDSKGERVRVSHRVYGEFPDTVWGRSLGWILVSVFDADLDAAQHTRVELMYLKETLEGEASVDNPVGA